MLMNEQNLPSESDLFLEVLPPMISTARMKFFLSFYCKNKKALQSLLTDFIGLEETISPMFPTSVDNQYVLRYTVSPLYDINQYLIFLSTFLSSKGLTGNISYGGKVLSLVQIEKLFPPYQVNKKRGPKKKNIPTQ